MYIETRISDAIFYKNVSGLRLQENNVKVFDVYEMKKSIDVYLELKKYAGNIKPKSDMEKLTHSYICNTIGYTYYLIYDHSNQHEERWLDLANKYMKKAVGAIEGIRAEGVSGRMIARYQRNCGLTYERKGELQSAKELYEKSQKNNINDYMTLNNIGAIEIKIMEKQRLQSKNAIYS